MSRVMGVMGFDIVAANIDKVKASIRPEHVETVLLDGAVVIGQTAINNAPTGPTGNLKRGIVAKTLQRRDPNQPAPAIVAVDYRIAPHAHLVEFGHFITHKRRGAATGWVPPHPFFRPAWDAQGETVKNTITESLKNIVEGAPA